MENVRVSILVETAFVPTELALVHDVLRIASRLGTNVSFSTQILTSSGENLIEGLGGILVRATPFAFEEANLPHHLVVLGGQGMRAAFEGVRARIRWLERMGCNLIFLSDAALEWNQLFPSKQNMTTHWENQQLLEDTQSIPTRGLPLFSSQGRVTTAGGMTASADVMLSKIVAPHSIHLAQSVAQVLLIDNIRNEQTVQPRSENDNISLRHANLQRAISVLEANIEEPISMSDLAQKSKMSIRQLERKFKKAFGCGPWAFYRTLRLRRGKTMVEQTNLSVIEIALSTGFANASGFSRMFCREFGMTPIQLRNSIVADVTRQTSHTSSKGSHHAPVPLSAHPSCSSGDAIGTDDSPVQRAWG